MQVSLLSCYEKRASWDDWVVGTHGITIDFDASGRHYTATYLPQIAVEEGALPARPPALRAAIVDPPRLGRCEAGWNNLQAIDTLVRKAGWRGAVDDGLRRSIALTRYQSTHRTLSYDEYRQLPSVLAAR